MLNRFGKDSSALLLQKRSFFEENEKHITKQREISKLYTTQPKRKSCKICTYNLESVDFVKDEIPYKFCCKCGHLNGSFEDTESFCQLVYGEDEGARYGENYSSVGHDYHYRVSSIYQPKVEFLTTSLLTEQEDISKLSFFDLGCGAGYFVSALLNSGISKVVGSEVSISQVRLGNTIIGKNVLSTHTVETTLDVVRNLKESVVSMIGVLEHLNDPVEILEAIKKNDNIEYIYLSIPMFSLSVFIEMISDEIFHRHLHGGHTHLFTQDSIDYLAKKINFNIVSKWSFGADVIDLYRFIGVILDFKKVSNLTKDKFRSMVAPLIDSMQIEIDKQGYSSELHLLLKRQK